MPSLDYRNGVSIAEIGVYVPALLIATILAFRHGFGRSSGWVFLIIFSLARIIGPSMQLATISDPTNTSLYTGAAILNNVGLSPLLLADLGFLSRLLTSISKNGAGIITPGMVRIVQLIITVALILGIVGGINASDDYVKNMNSGAKYQPGTLSQAGIALMLLSYIILVIFSAITGPSVQYAEAGEKRIFVAIIASLPFLLVRLVYSCVSIFANSPDFNLLTGNVTLLLCVALLEEFCVVVIFETMGLLLQKVAREDGHVEAMRQDRSVDSSTPMQHRSEGQSQKQATSNNAFVGFAKKTIIGRIVMSVIPSEEPEIEMQRGHRRR